MLHIFVFGRPLTRLLTLAAIPMLMASASYASEVDEDICKNQPAPVFDKPFTVEKSWWDHPDFVRHDGETVGTISIGRIKPVSDIPDFSELECRFGDVKFGYKLHWSNKEEPSERVLSIRFNLGNHNGLFFPRIRDRPAYLSLSWILDSEHERFIRIFYTHPEEIEAIFKDILYLSIYEVLKNN